MALAVALEAGGSMTTHRPMTEAQVQQSILERIGAAPGVRVFRMNSGTARNPRTGQVVRFGVPGMADLLVLVQDRYAWIEVKSARGRQSPEQVRFQRAIEAIGGVYAIARSADDAAEVVRHLRDAP